MLTLSFPCLRGMAQEPEKALGRRRPAKGQGLAAEDFSLPHEPYSLRVGGWDLTG